MMNNKVKAGTVTLAAVAAAGIAFGISGVNASAAEITDDDVVEMEETESEEQVSNADEAAQDVADALEEVEQSQNDLAKAKHREADAAQKAADMEAVEKQAIEDYTLAESVDEEAEKALEDAAEEAEKAAADLEAAQGLRSGDLDITETVQYQDAEKKKTALNDAKETMDSADAAVRTAEKDLEHASADVHNRESAVREAADDLIHAENMLQEKKNLKSETDEALSDAAARYATAQADADRAGEGYREAADVYKAAQEHLMDSQEKKETADLELQKAKAEKETADKSAREVYDEQIREEEACVAAAYSVYESAREALLQYHQGTLGLIDWMLKKDSLSKVQLQDLQFARTVLENAAIEDFSKWNGGENVSLPEDRNGKVVVIGDSYDATSLTNLLHSIEIMKKINELRASDDNYTGDLKRNDACTNFFFMATAEAGAMRGAGLGRHSSLTTSCENLSFGFSDPTFGWYNREKAVFDRIKMELGITWLRSEEDIERIEKEADRQNVVVGHYTNLFWAADQVMGVGFTQYNVTSCYNASKASNYTNDQYNRGMHLYTLEEYESLVLEYYNEINAENCHEAFGEVIQNLNAAQEKLDALKAERDRIADAAVRDAIELIEEKKAVVAAALEELTAAKGEADATEQAFAQAKLAKEVAEQVLKETSDILEQTTVRTNEAAVAVRSAEDDVAAKQAASDKAEAALTEAIRTRAEAENILDKQKEAALSAKEKYILAESAYGTARKALEDLTSDDTIRKLKEKSDSADAAYRLAYSHKQATEAAWLKAEHILIKAIQDSEEAKTNLEEAQEELREAEDALAEARENLVEKQAIYAEWLRREQTAAAVEKAIAEMAQEEAIAVSSREGSHLKPMAIIPWNTGSREPATVIPWSKHQGAVRSVAIGRISHPDTQDKAVVMADNEKKNGFSEVRQDDSKIMKKLLTEDEMADVYDTGLHTASVHPAPVTDPMPENQNGATYSTSLNSNKRTHGTAGTLAVAIAAAMAGGLTFGVKRRRNQKGNQDR